MPTPASSVGPIAVPYPAGAQDAPISDATVRGVLLYFAFWARYALNPKLATMTAPPVADACPTANCYDCNPSSLVARFNRPALFCWWDGKSVTKPWTTMKDVRARDLHLIYVFDRVASDTINGVDARQRYTGLISALDAAWNRAAYRRAHPSYAPLSAAGLPCRPGTPLAVALGLNGLDYVGGQEGFLQELPTASARNAALPTQQAARLSRGNANGIVQGYPSLHSVVRVLEEVGFDSPLPSDIQGDVAFEPTTGPDPNSQLALDTRYMPSLDAVEET